MPTMWWHGYTTSSTDNLWRRTTSMGMDEGKNRRHEKNGPKMDRDRLVATSTIPFMAPTKTQSDTMDPSDICDVSIKPRERDLWGFPGLYQRELMETIWKKRQAKIGGKLPSNTCVVECENYNLSCVAREQQTVMNVSSKRYLIILMVDYLSCYPNLTLPNFVLYNYIVSFIFLWRSSFRE